MRSFGIFASRFSSSSEIPSEKYYSRPHNGRPEKSVI